MRRLFLKLGDQIFHKRFPLWGPGEVVEVRASTLSGGICLVRVVFRDGVERSFFNDMEDRNCCYYMGVRLWEEPSLRKNKFHPFS